MTTQLADNPVFAAANETWRKTYAYLKTLPVDFWQSAVLFLSLFWLSHSAANLFWLVYPVPDMPQPSHFAEPVQKNSTAVVSTADVDLEALQALKLFGDAGDAVQQVAENSQPDPLVDDDAATTKLNLQLQGLISSDNAAEARAIIAAGSEQSLYRIGEEIKDNRGVKLAKVMDQRIILDNNGHFESLWLYSEEDFKNSASARKTSHQVPRSGRPPAAKAPPVDRSIARSQIPKSISDVVRFSVHREDGSMVGYKIRPGRDRALFEQVGLKTGDVVTTVNGRAMTDPKQLREVYQDLKTATEANLVVRRGDNELPITIRVDNTGG